MKDSVLFASVVGVVNTIVLNLCKFISSSTDAHQIATNVAQALSPFAALALVKIYTKIDHPPELVRKEAALGSAIKVCKKHLKDKDAPEEFKVKTREQLSELMLQQQKIRVEFEKNNVYKSSLQSNESSSPD
ncbi:MULTISPECIES: hypothetical protein [unclassified Pseudomonas]|uniref:hypothetical protein n=1 Tax=unclassified Pseudomonas TaxID=196821 RepID=UPI0008712133|nr:MULTISPECIES: hypothetical protein [unclassified Pseudomonas]SCW99547.1 hypothetical protein SAMN03159481_05719 [Pseudomonas sp. NFACC56-3]SFL06849.1 hypothetical protein SAMN03159473_05574 [Pseudomonas sp. NFACC52]